MNQALYFCHGAPVDDPIKTATAQFDSLSLIRPNGGIHLVGFSIGAMVAAHIPAAGPERVNRLKLVPPAAPLQLGKFLPQMAGHTAFRLAARHPRLFSARTYGQGDDPCRA